MNKVPSPTGSAGILSARTAWPLVFFFHSQLCSSCKTLFCARVAQILHLGLWGIHLFLNLSLHSSFYSRTLFHGFQVLSSSSPDFCLLSSKKLLYSAWSLALCASYHEIVYRQRGRVMVILSKGLQNFSGKWAWQRLSSDWVQLPHIFLSCFIVFGSRLVWYPLLRPSWLRGKVSFAPP